MSNPAGFDFTKFVPGFDFLKNLTPGGAASAASSAAPGWVAPTLDPEELEKRIQELKTVQFWLEQNSKAVGATVQALEVQRMTLQTLKGMNMSFNDLAESLKVKPEAAAVTPEPAKTESEPEAAKRPAPESKTKTNAAGVDPAQWWGALTDQFQHIATHAMKDMSHRANAHVNAAAPPAKPVAKKAARKTAPRKTAARQTTASKAAAKPKR
jgi:hypothetical protein